MFESSAIKTTGFKQPVSFAEGLERTIKYKFVDKTAEADQVFYTE
jgi:hypothetical protein